MLNELELQGYPIEISFIMIPNLLPSTDKSPHWVVSVYKTARDRAFKIALAQGESCTLEAALYETLINLKTQGK